MAEKISVKNSKKNKSKKLSLKEIKENLSAENACYVLITCKTPTQKGEMEVEMAYDGDETLACYLLESAQSVFDQKIEQSIDSL